MTLSNIVNSLMAPTTANMKAVHMQKKTGHNMHCVLTHCPRTSMGLANTIDACG